VSQVFIISRATCPTCAIALSVAGAILVFRCERLAARVLSTTYGHPKVTRPVTGPTRAVRPTPGGGVRCGARGDFIEVGVRRTPSRTPLGNPLPFRKTHARPARRATRVDPVVALRDE